MDMLMSEFRIKVVDIIDQPDGSALVNIDIDDETINLIKTTYGWKRWNTKRFQKLFIEALSKNIQQEKKSNA
jgi:hypothetical protein